MDAIDLDHVALAVERWADAFPRFTGDLGGRWRSGGKGPGFAPCQLEYANKMKVELIAPNRIDINDFLRRFLDRSGPGPHHVTFKVKDIVAALAEVEAAGYRPASVDLRDPNWKEAFLHPKESCGIVVQLAQAAGDWEPKQRDGLPPPRTTNPAVLDHVAHGVPSIAEARLLFVDLLGGREVATGEGWVELGWPGPGRIRLLQRPGPPRVSHLTFTCDAPEEIPDARLQDDGTWVVEAADNLGTRLILRPRG